MKLGPWLLGACLGMLAPTGHAQALVDGDFKAWSFGAYGNGGSAAASVEPTGGNPGARIKVATVSLPSETAFGTALIRDFPSTAALAGVRFIMTLGVLSGEGAFGTGQSIALLLEQAGSLYALPVGDTGIRPSFSPVPFSGTLDAASFVRVAGSGPSHPVLDGSATTRFGFAAGNSGALAQTQYYDNFSLELAPARVAKAVTLDRVEAVPTLSEFALGLLSAALMAAGMAARRRRAR